MNVKNELHTFVLPGFAGHVLMINVFRYSRFVYKRNYMLTVVQYIVTATCITLSDHCTDFIILGCLGIKLMFCFSSMIS